MSDLPLVKPEDFAFPGGFESPDEKAEFLQAVRDRVLEAAAKNAAVHTQIQGELLVDMYNLWKFGVFPDGKECRRDTSRTAPLKFLKSLVTDEMIMDMLGIGRDKPEERRKLQINVVMKPVGVAEAVPLLEGEEV